MPEQSTFGDLLQGFRKRKRWSQAELARRMGVHRNTISFWERGEYLPETLASVWELVRVLALQGEEARLLLEARFGTLAVLSLHTVPFQRNPYFTGRQMLLEQLHEKLRAGKQVALTQAISGLGGIGKTQAALEYVYRYRESYHDIFWADADTPESLTGAFVSLAAQLALPEKDERSQSKIITAVQRWLSTHKNWLFVLDNVEDLGLVTTFIPPNRQGAVVLTTRTQVTEPIAQAIELDTLSDAEGTLFLLRRTKRLALEDDVEVASQADRVEAESISQTLGGLPLALDQAGAFILETGCALVDFLPLYQQRRVALLERRGLVPTDHPASVTTTFSLLFEKVNHVNPVAIELLRFCAFLAVDAIPEEIITKGAAQLGPLLLPVATDPLALNDALE